MTGFGDCCLKGIVKADTSSRGEKNDNESRTVLRVILFIFVAYIFNTWIFVFVMIYLFVRATYYTLARIRNQLRSVS